MIHVGVLSPVTGGLFYGEALSGVVREVAAAGGWVTLVQTLDAGLNGDDIVPAPPITSSVGLAHIDGYVAIAHACDEVHLRRLRVAGKPVVLTSTVVEGVDAASVAADNAGGIRAAVDHLVAHGHTRIAFASNFGQTDMVERHEGYQQAMAAHGLSTDGLFLPASDHVETGGASAAAALLAVGPPVTAVVASTDRVALGLIQTLRTHGIRVPQDVAVTGFDNAQIGWHSMPPLSTVDQQIVEIGADAAQLLLAELAGEPVEHRRYTVASKFIARPSCGCRLYGADATSLEGQADGEALVAAIGRRLGLVLTDPTVEGVDLASVDLRDVGDLIATTIERLYPKAPSPETLGHFTRTVMGRLGSASDSLAAARLPGAEVLRFCMAQMTVLLSNLQELSGIDRAEHLSRSLGEQYDVGIGLLGRLGSDPTDLAWLDHVDVRLACLGLWDGPPEIGLLRIAGVYDPAGVLGGAVSPTFSVEEFPPRVIVEQTDTNAGEVTFVVPIKGASGDHGYLCVVGAVDTYSGTGRATYNHWAALLGVALQQQRLMETVRQSEERYSLATRATHDGLWDWDVVSGRCYYSQRCQELLGASLEGIVDAGPFQGRETTLELAPWMDRIHPGDLPKVRDGLRHAVVSQDPFELEHRVRSLDGTYRWMLCRARAVGAPGKAARRIVGALSDIHERKQLEEQLRQGALYDTVTGLPNRRLFLDRLAWAVEQAQRRDGTRFAVVFLDLDGFKLINDSLGHLMGDLLLQAVGERLRSDLRTVDTAARFGGDEFAVLLYGLKSESVLAIVERLQERIAEPVMLGETEVSVTASIGVASSDTGYTSAEDVLRDADIAMYHAKESERGTASVFDPVMHTRATDRLRAQSELRTALLGHQFVVHYQPVVALDGSALTQFESLVRWQHPERGLLLPAEFLPIMSESGTIVVLGQWIVEAVCAQIAEWRRHYDGPLTVSVNLSHREFWSDQLLLTVTQALSRHHVPSACLILEITESVIMADPDAARQIMGDLHANGIRMHIDDFGTGQSSLHALRAFPVDALKIDQSFVQQIDVDRQTTELVRIIVGMGQTLGLAVVAEGVETKAQADSLRAMGCGTAQGWLYAKAVPGDEAGRLLGTLLAERPALASSASLASEPATQRRQRPAHA